MDIDITNNNSNKAQKRNKMIEKSIEKLLTNRNVIFLKIHIINPKKPLSQVFWYGC